MRRSLLIPTAAVLAALGSGAAMTASASAKSPACKTGQLVATLGNPNGAAGSTYYELTFANLGSACTLSGFPGVSAVNVKGAQLGSPATRSGGAVKTVTLKAATAETFSTASATLRVVDAGNFPSTKCRQTLAAGLRIYPPNQKVALAVPLPFGACSKSGTEYLSIGAVK